MGGGLVPSFVCARLALPRSRAIVVPGRRRERIAERIRARRRARCGFLTYAGAPALLSAHRRGRRRTSLRPAAAAIRGPVAGPRNRGSSRRRLKRVDARGDLTDSVNARWHQKPGAQEFQVKPRRSRPHHLGEGAVDGVRRSR